MLVSLGLVGHGHSISGEFVDSVKVKFSEPFMIAIIQGGSLG